MTNIPEIEVCVDLMAIERTEALKYLPDGYAVVPRSDCVASGDLLWSYLRSTWVPVRVPAPFVRGQKRPGGGQFTEVGDPVARYVAVARKT